MRGDTIRLLSFMLLASLCAMRTFGQEAAVEQADQVGVDDERTAASAEASALLAELTCRIDSRATPAEALPESILNWSNPDVGPVYGDVFLWLEQGRPQGVASIYRWFHPYDSLTIEFCSLSNETIAVNRSGEVIWEPAETGITWNPVPDAPQPARTRALRLSQLKQIARRFSAELTDARTDEDGVNKVLRLLPQPLYRYPQSGGGEDGGLFAMVVGTDPELLLLVESDGDGWQFGVARMNRDALDVKLDRRHVASFPHIENELYDTRRPYCCVVVDNED